LRFSVAEHAVEISSHTPPQECVDAKWKVTIFFFFWLKEQCTES
jgi:hypothetical protein